METKALLETLGLSRSESEVFLALLRSGKSSASKIIQKTKMHRPDVYDTLEKLVEKGIATRTIENNVRVYSTSFNSLPALLDEQKREIEEKESLLNKNLKKLSSLESTSALENELEVCRGVNGMSRIFDSMNERMEKGDVVYIYGRPGFTGPREEYYDKAVLQFHKKRSEKKVQCYAIYPYSRKKQIQKRKQHPPIKIRYSSKEFDFPGVVHIFKDEVYFWDTSESEITVFVIRNKVVAKMQLAYYWLLWKQASPKAK